LLGLHGLQSDLRLFQPFFDDPRFAEFSLLAPDLLGFGLLRDLPPVFSYDLLDQAAYVAGAIEQEGIQKVTVIGHSVGGMIGTLLLKLIPEKIEALVSLEGNLTEADCGESLNIARLTVETFGGPSAVFYTAQSIVKWAESRELERLFTESAHKKLLLRGETSHFQSRPVAANVTTQTIPGSGHFLLRDNSAATLAAIRAFI